MIIAANPAFAKFVMGLQVEVEGLPVRSTALAERVEHRGERHPAQRSRAIRSGGSSRSISPMAEVRRLLLWLDAVSREQVPLGVQPLDL
ncbi:MAG: hypothetical protein IPQ07_36855 [Myxococcales bacterium]|nr:hypothetical protein [Myxococcales bacterium]